MSGQPAESPERGRHFPLSAGASEGADTGRRRLPPFPCQAARSGPLLFWGFPSWTPLSLPGGGYIRRPFKSFPLPSSGMGVKLRGYPGFAPAEGGRKLFQATCRRFAAEDDSLRSTSKGGERTVQAPPAPFSGQAYKGEERRSFGAILPTSRCPPGRSSRGAAGDLGALARNVARESERARGGEAPGRVRGLTRLSQPPGICRGGGGEICSGVDRAFRAPQSWDSGRRGKHKAPARQQRKHGGHRSLYPCFGIGQQGAGGYHFAR